jgi:hypothetical protein
MIKLEEIKKTRTIADQSLTEINTTLKTRGFVQIIFGLLSFLSHYDTFILPRLTKSMTFLKGHSNST